MSDHFGDINKMVETKKAALGDLLKYCSGGTIGQRYFELVGHTDRLRFELSGNSGGLELMPVSWANGMERYSCTSRDLLRRYARCYHVLFIPSNSGELKIRMLVKAFEFIKHIDLYNEKTPPK